MEVQNRGEDWGKRAASACSFCGASYYVLTVVAARAYHQLVYLKPAQPHTPITASAAQAAVTRGAANRRLATARDCEQRSIASVRRQGRWSPPVAHPRSSNVTRLQGCSSPRFQPEPSKVLGHSG